MLLKDLPNPWRSNRTYMSRKSFLKNIGKLTGPMPHGFIWGLVLLKDLSKTSNTARYFHAQITRKIDNIYDNVVNNENNGI